MEGAKLFFSFTNPTENTVVRSNKNLLRAFDQDRPPNRAHSRVDHRRVNRAWRKILITGKQIESGGPDIMRWNFVSYINDARGRINGQNRAFHGANEIILRAKVGKESDDRGFQVSSFKLQVST